MFLNVPSVTDINFPFSFLTIFKIYVFFLIRQNLKGKHYLILSIPTYNSFLRVCPKSPSDHVAIIIILHFLVIFGDGLPIDLFIPMHLE